MRSTLTILLCLLLAGPLHAQLAKELLKALPDSLCPTLTAVNRADFIDFMECGMKAEVSNRLGGKSQMTDLTADYLRIRLSEQSSWQLKVLPLEGGGSVVCTIHTVTAPAADSRIGFYTPQWEALPATRYLAARPTTDDFLLPADSTQLSPTRYAEAVRRADVPLTEALLQADAPILTFRLSTPDYLSAEEAEALRPLLRPQLTYTWDGTHFVQKK